MVELHCWDLAVFDFKSDWEYDHYSKNAGISKFYSFLNNVSETGRRKSLPFELEKTPRDIFIINLAVNAAREYMIFFKRDKIIDIPLCHIHLVSEKSIHEDSLFGGVVVEQVADDIVFAIKLFQKIFVKMSFSAVGVRKDRKIISIGVADVFKEAAASLISRRFLKEIILKNDFFVENKLVSEEEYFNLEAEKVFDDALKDFRRENVNFISQEKLFNNIIDSVINGAFIG
ncbi:MAG: hypothetical protein WC319_05020 [Candidatus Paceibacterota bacterium]|jgi:hypothetical protein